MKAVRVPKILAVVLTSAVSLSQAMAAGTSTHGGTVLTCADGRMPVLLDLFEAENETDAPKTIVRSNEPMELQAMAALAKLRFARDAEIDVQAELEIVLAHYASDNSTLPHGMKLFPSGDTAPDFIPEGCELRQVVTYKADGKILFDKERISQLAPTDMAALMVHEAVYKVNREFRAVSVSKPARVITGALFGSEPLGEQERDFVLRNLLTPAKALMTTEQFIPIGPKDGARAALPLQYDSSDDIRVRLRGTGKGSSARCAVALGQLWPDALSRHLVQVKDHGWIEINRRQTSTEISLGKTAQELRPLNITLFCVDTKGAAPMIEILQGNQVVLSRPLKEGNADSFLPYVKARLIPLMN